MAERTTGWRRILSQPWAYRLAQRGIGSPNVRLAVAEEYLHAEDGDRILDIGCGTGDLLEHLPAVHYVGYDPSDEYIEAARTRFGDRGTFKVGGVGSVDIQPGTFNLCVAKGVLHHLDDGVAAQLFQDASSALQPGGRLVTIDPTFEAGQSPIARFLAKRDRGQNVRTSERYAQLAATVFDDVEVTVRHDLLHVPYSHAILVATRQ